jgi:hypothetical protein
VSVTALPLGRDAPPIVEAWFRQLLDPEFLELLRLAGDRQVDVRLSASGGKVRRRPVIAFDAGPQDYCEP